MGQNFFWVSLIMPLSRLALSLVSYIWKQEVGSGEFGKVSGKGMTRVVLSVLGEFNNGMTDSD